MSIWLNTHRAMHIEASILFHWSCESCCLIVWILVREKFTLEDTDFIASIVVPASFVPREGAARAADSIIQSNGTSRG